MNNYAPKHRTNYLRIKTAFVSSILKDAAERIRADQTKTADEWNLFKNNRFGISNLEQSLKGHFSIDNQEGGAKLSMRYLKYHRFLDMHNVSRKVRDGYHIYNKILFGNIYSNAIPRIMYNLSDEVRALIGDKLAEIESARYPRGKEASEALHLISTEVDRNLAAVIAKSARMGYY